MGVRWRWKWPKGHNIKFCGGIVGVRNKDLAAKPRAEWRGGLWNTAWTKTMGFWIVRTPVCGKKVLVERSTHVNQMFFDSSCISQGTLSQRFHEFLMHVRMPRGHVCKQSFRMIDFVSSSKEQCESTRPFGFTINTLSWVVCLLHKFSTFNSAEKCVQIGWFNWDQLRSMRS